jgi:hypothetical protein
MQKYTGRYCRAFFSLLSAAIFLFCSNSVFAQQRPLLTEDARLIPASSVELETGFTYEDQAVYTLSNLEGTHLALLPSGVHFGLGDRAEFQMTGTVQDYLKPADNVWHSDFGDLSLSTKMKIVSESPKMPIISFRPTVVLPNANQASGLGLNTTRFFASVLAGKTIGKAFLYGNFGLGIMDDPTIANAQNDVLTYGLAAIVPVASHFKWVGEITGLQNPRKGDPVPGSETRSQVRTGLQIEAAGIRWDVGVLAGLTSFDPRYGVTFGLTKRISFK